MDRIIIINGVPYICHQAYNIEKISNDDNKNKNKNSDLKTCKFKSIYNGKVITVKYIEIHNIIEIEVYYDEIHKMIVNPSFIGIDIESNDNQLWAFYYGIWYKIAGSNNKLSKEQMNEILNKKESTKVEVKAKVQKLDVTDKNQRVWHVKSIKTQEDKKYIFPVKNIIANMAKWIYYQDPINHSTSYQVHKIYIPEILHLLYMNLIKDGRKIENRADEDFYYFEYTKEELRKYLYFLVYDGPKTKNFFSKLNLSYNEMKNGIDVSDPNRDTISFSSRYFGPKWEDDFIDLDALINNVVLDCVKDSVAAE